MYGMILAILLGGAVGFGLSYGLLNGQIQSLQSELQTVSDEYDMLNSDLTELGSDLSKVNNTVVNLPTEWTELDYE
jgi:hypothetical protein